MVLIITPTAHLFNPLFCFRAQPPQKKLDLTLHLYRLMSKLN